MLQNLLDVKSIFGKIFLILLLLSFLGGCISGEVEKKTDTVAIENNNDSSEAEVDNLHLKEEIESLKEQVKYIEEHNEYLVTLIKEIMEDLPDEAMLNFAQNQFKYELQINGEPIRENGEVSVSAGELEIVIVEEGFVYELLPPKWIEQG